MHTPCRPGERARVRCVRPFPARVADWQDRRTAGGPGLAPCNSTTTCIHINLCACVCVRVCVCVCVCVTNRFENISSGLGQYNAMPAALQDMSCVGGRGEILV